MTTPTVVTSPHSAREWSQAHQILGERVALVPTMGALHDGHLALIKRAQLEADRVIVSIFVNPTQFNQRDDFESYPRTVDNDLTICARAGVDCVYLPGVDEVYPVGFDTRIEPGRVAHAWEGANRPGHFAGVATIVVKLINACAPDVAIFGRKDVQQLAVIRQTVTDLDMPTLILGVDTVREPDGLAMSSRNRRLDPDARVAATAIHRGLLIARRHALDPMSSASSIESAAMDVIRSAAESVDYVAVVDATTLEAPSHDDDRSNWIIIVAAWFGGVRLIDNATLCPDDELCG